MALPKDNNTTANVGALSQPATNNWGLSPEQMNYYKGLYDVSPVEAIQYRQNLQRANLGAPPGPTSMPSAPMNGGAAIPSGEMPANSGAAAPTPGSPQPAAPGGSFQGFPNMYSMASSGAGGNLQDLFSQAMGGSINSFNTAANRLRERLDTSARGDLQKAQAMNLSRGFGVSGGQDVAQYRNMAAKNNAYAQGLSGLANDFEKNRLQGLGIAGDVARTDVGNRNFMDQTLYNLLNNREQRGSDYTLAQMGNNTQRSIANQNASQQQWQQQMQSWLQQFLSGMQTGQNQYPRQY